MMEQDDLFMRRAIELAEWGRGYVSPNPMVGCVIVHQNQIIGEGYHEKYGGPHAEPNAVANVKDKSLLSESTVYVSLEPCAHWGKTPPCANMLVDHQVKRVVIGAMDSNPQVAGKGISILKEAGIAVRTGVLENEARAQNRRFFTFIEKKRPYIILKWAKTQDGFIARKNFDSKWISNAKSRQLVHKWRAEEDAILVGYRTALHDNPKLNVRDWEGKNPIRVILDRKLQLSQELSVFDGSQKTIWYNEIEDTTQVNLEKVKLPKGFGPAEFVQDLYERKIQSVLIEGGAAVLESFIQANLWDEARVFTGAGSFEKGINAPTLSHANRIQSYQILSDQLEIFLNS